MKLFRKAFHGKNKNKEGLGNTPRPYTLAAGLGAGLPAQVKRNAALDFSHRLDADLIKRILYFVCSHAADTSYVDCEGSSIDGVCALCSLKDLAQCALVSRRWGRAANELLYHTIRIEAVHYCPREGELAEKRKKGRNADFEDPGQARIRLLTRTFRDVDNDLGKQVRFFKLPIMLRQNHIAALAKIVSVMPMLQYVDLPDNFFKDPPNCKILRQELFMRCPNIKKMTYDHGSEAALVTLARTNNWPNLEVLDCENLSIDPAAVRHAAARLSNLKALKLCNLPDMNDYFFLQNHRNIPNIPALEELILHSVPGVLAQGLANYFERTDVGQSLTTLSLQDTGILACQLQFLLDLLPNLRKLSMIEVVQNSFSDWIDIRRRRQGSDNDWFPTTDEIPALESKNLEILNYEIIGDPSVTATYYEYLTGSLLRGGLPELKEIYVRDADFANSLVDYELIVPPPLARNANRLSSNNPFNENNLSGGRPCPSRRPFNKELLIYTKGHDGQDTWDFTRIEDPLPPPPRTQKSGNTPYTHRASASRSSVRDSRPMSQYGLSIGGGDMLWDGGLVSPSFSASYRNGDIRRSVMSTDGAGGFLPIPVNDMPIRPSTSGGRPGGSPGGLTRKNTVFPGTSDTGHARSTGLAPPPMPQMEEKRGSKIDLWR